MRNANVALPRVQVHSDSPAAAAAADDDDDSHNYGHSHDNNNNNNNNNNSHSNSSGENNSELPPRSRGGGERSAVIRARYESDVRGVNRYKHFHRPVTVQESFGTNAESIDKKVSPRSPRKLSRSPNTAGDLPQIDANSDSELRKLINNNKPPNGKNASNNNNNNKNVGAECGASEAVAQSGQPTTPIVDTWRIRKRPPPSKDGENRSPVQNGIIMMEALLELKQPGKDNPPKAAAAGVLQRQNSSGGGGGGFVTLPEIPQQRPANGTTTANAGANMARTAATQAQKSRETPQIVDQKYRPRPGPSISMGRETSSTSLNPASISRIDAMLTSPSPNISSDVGIVTHQSHFEAFSKKVDRLPNANGTTGGAAATAAAAEAKKLVDEEAAQRKRETLIQLQQQRYVNRPSPSSTPKPASSTRRTVEFGTQTDTKFSHENGTFRQNPVLYTPSSSTTESTSVPTNNSDRRTPKATQTDNFNNLFTNRLNNICAENINEIEQRTELLEIIDSALGETIDKESRLLANQFIASSARKQAQVWRDAKEFVSTMLVPYSVELANKARSTRLPFEHIANIQLP